MKKGCQIIKCIGISIIKISHFVRNLDFSFCRNDNVTVPVISTPPRRGRNLAQISTRKQRGLCLFFLLMLFGFYFSSIQKADAWPFWDARNAERLYKAGKFDKALELYQRAIQKLSDNLFLNFNIGDCEYKQGKFEDSVKNFEKSSSSKDELLKEKSLYNIGNSYYKNKDYDKAVKYYEKALLENPNFEDAKFNLELALKEKENQKKEQQQKDKNKNQKDKNKDKDKNKNQDKDKNKDKEKDKKQNQQGDNKKDPDKLTPEQLQQLLQAIKDAEKKTKDKVQNVPYQYRVEKDW